MGVGVWGARRVRGSALGAVVDRRGCCIWDAILGAGPFGGAGRAVAWLPILDISARTISTAWTEDTVIFTVGEGAGL